MNVNKRLTDIFDTHLHMSNGQREEQELLDGANEYLRITYILDKLHINYVSDMNTQTIVLKENEEYVSIKFHSSFILFSMHTELYNFEKFIFLKESYQIVMYVKMFKNRKKKRAILFGGCFNPVTLAHLQVAEELAKAKDSYVIMVPTCDEYLRDYKKLSGSDVIDASTRLHALCEATLENMNIIVDDIEVLEHRSITRTLRTLYNLKDKYKVEDLGFTIGSSDLETLHTWWNITISLQEFYCYVVSRLDFDGKKYVESDHILSQYKEHFRYLEYNTIYSDVSSTKVRQSLASSDDSYAREYMPEVAYEIVKERSMKHE